MYFGARYFGALQKLPKLELTIRTPYQSFFHNFTDFGRIQVTTIEGQITISNRTIPRVYLLPPGQLNVIAMAAGAGKNTSSESGQFMHTGGWLFVHVNNSCEINLLECTEKENFKFDNLDKAVENETHSAPGRVAAILQNKTVALLNRKR